MNSSKTVCASLGLKRAEAVKSPNFSLDEVKQAVGELKLGRSADPTGMVSDLYKVWGWLALLTSWDGQRHKGFQKSSVRLE